ncbi:MAG TPA: DUF3536 domain-containing protein, partial [Terriglobales bacterium]|nr:DUF3536 domain-containing protein [Terriglobales bacterium]
GLERWRSDCGCNSGGRPGWHQAWRAPLRAALDWLRDQLAPAYQHAAAQLLWNAWSARNDFIELVLDESPKVAAAFLARHARYPLNAREQERVWSLLQVQRHAMLMYTSCGWFFDDVSGIETAQILSYAAHAIDLAAAALDLSLESEFARRLEAAPSNDPRWGNARAVYEAQLRRRPHGGDQAG